MQKFANGQIKKDMDGNDLYEIGRREKGGPNPHFLKKHGLGKDS